MRLLLPSIVCVAACGSNLGSDGIDATIDDGGRGSGDDGGDGIDAAPTVPQHAELWYVIDDLLVYVP